MRLHESLLALLTVGALASFSSADEFKQVIQPTLAKYCTHCHGDGEVNGKVDFQSITSRDSLLKQPVLIKNVMDVLDGNDMPPEGEPEPSEAERTQLRQAFQQLLVEAARRQPTPRLQIRRLNRFQYNNAIRDLFQMKRDVFPLPEKLMTRYTPYLATGKVPEKVQVASHSLKPVAGLREVKPFPKDLRASHGFDNQANQLTLSPLLLDSFLRLSVSIVESPDFTPETVGIWAEFFEAPPQEKLGEELRKRLRRFLSLAFRRPIDDKTLERYAKYAEKKLAEKLPYSSAMKKVASAVLSSPRFLYRPRYEGNEARQFELASDLSFFLWASIPDRPLLELAAAGKLSDPKQLEATLQRMLADPKIERFLDTFPSQWMQLENILAATPDPGKSRFFSLDKNFPASLQMVVEPLLLFDTVFLENRPIVDLISPDFAYQSNLLKNWYESDLKPAKLDVAGIEAENAANDQKRKDLGEQIAKFSKELESLVEPARNKILAARAKGQKEKPVDLKPYAAWEFNGNLEDELKKLPLKPNGKIRYEDGMVVLDRAYLQSKPLPFDLREKSLEVWLKLDDVNQRGGGAMGIQGPGDFFDTIVLGERKPQHWISGSNGFARTLDFPGSTPEKAGDQIIHLVMVYQKDGTTQLYRNGEPYGKPYRKGGATFPKNRTTVLFGLRHLPAGGNRYLKVRIDRARLYNRPLTLEEVSSSFNGHNVYVTDKELDTQLNEADRTRTRTLRTTLAERTKALNGVPPRKDIAKLRQQASQQYDDRIRGMLRSREFVRIAAKDPRYGGVITNAAMLSMTSGPDRTHPIARGAWIIEVIFNDPPPPPPNDVPPLNEDAADKNLTIREKFAAHRENPDCAACHSRLDPLGFALENFDITGRWRDRYENGRKVDSSGTLMRKYPFQDVVKFKKSLVSEKQRFAKAFTAHLLRFALARELTPFDSLEVEAIVKQAASEDYRLKAILKQVVLSRSFRGNAQAKR